VGRRRLDEITHADPVVSVAMWLSQHSAGQLRTSRTLQHLVMTKFTPRTITMKMFFKISPFVFHTKKVI